MPDPTARPSPYGRTAPGVALCGLVCFLTLAAQGVPSQLRETPIVKAVQRARPAVVNIRGEKTVPPTAAADMAEGDAGRRVNGMGTGVVIDPRGYVLTNYHVVDGVRKIQVTTGEGRQFIGRLVERDPETDLAIIKIDAPGELSAIPLGTSSDLMPGETVLAVGNAYGYEHTVTQGIISALHRAVQVNDAQFYDDLIQTDASINPGNSGGPLLNIDGEMIGINVAVRAGAQGIGFAIPANKAIAVAAKLLADNAQKSVRHGVVLGAEADNPEKELLVASVESASPAAEVGLKQGDRLTAVGDLEIRRGLDFHRALLDRKTGEKVTLAVQRDGKPLTLEMTLAAATPPAKLRQDPLWETLGLELATIPPDQFRKDHHTRYRGGLAVTAVRPDSPAGTTGIRCGDVLVGMHIWETVSLENVSYILNRSDFESLSPVKFFILRSDETLYGYLPVTTKTAQRP